MVRLSALAGVLAAAGAHAADVGLANPALDELSGLAHSLRDPEVLWGHNDSGNSPTLFRIGVDGSDLGAFRMREARNVDWEDLAAFHDRGAPALLVADVGDNFAGRGYSSLYAFSDPGAGDRAPAKLWRLDFTYPDGPRDCEAVAVDEGRGEILLLTKRDRPPVLYRLRLPQGPPRERVTAERLGPITLPLSDPAAARFGRKAGMHWHQPTALDIRRDGALAVVVTYWNAYAYVRNPAETWIEALSKAPRVIPLPRLRHIEAGALATDGRSLFVGTEGPGARLGRVPVD